METVSATESRQSQASHWQSWLMVLLLIYLLLAAVGAIGDGFKAATGDNARDLFSFASNPFVALIVGLVATALIQSSSTVTSIIVGLVAGGLPISIAIPMAMGANIGTSLTSTLVSLGHVRNGDEFRKAFAAATVHDSFNLLAVALLLPLEIVFQPLERASGFFAQILVSDNSVSVSDFNFMKMILAPAGNTMDLVTSWLPGIFSGLALIVLGIVLILFVVSRIGRILRTLLVGKAKDVMHAAVGRGPLAGIASGTVMTVLVQSSSTTTALIVPLAGNGVFSLRQVYPFTLGANIGTTITALLAATAIHGPMATLALQIALVHLFFNLLAILVIFGIPLLRNIPLLMAENLARLALLNKLYVVAYILGVFFLLPLSAIAVSQIF
ncbi:Na/Pi cotransporter family protein [Pseudohongiella spirulinae]|uniref:Na+/Pi-cotransporter n=1 Tax=Pseudohongiella spirulinae TaxID=1249552 RepID=A0A0S2KGP6_9GAMM|nr:Na+/Pi-cotransporter [Pseudohongiella spirulinae]